jgi:hypothetical protein
MAEKLRSYAPKFLEMAPYDPLIASIIQGNSENYYLNN